MRWIFFLAGLALAVASVCLLPQEILAFVESHSVGSVILVIVGAVCLIAAVVFLWLGRQALSGSAPPGRLDEDPINKLPPGGVMMWGKDGVDGIIHSKSTNFDKRD
ncbi:MAG: hypothetical protein ABI400_07050 [Lacisediminihabitans sp.]